MGKGARRGQQKPNITQRNATKPDWTLRRNGVSRPVSRQDASLGHVPVGTTISVPGLKFNNLMRLRHELVQFESVGWDSRVLSVTASMQSRTSTHLTQAVEVQKLS
jgi:hypothetical protein